MLKPSMMARNLNAATSAVVAGTPAAGLGRGTLNASGYPEHGDALREQLTVALVVCLI